MNKLSLKIILPAIVFLNLFSLCGKAQAQTDKITLTISPPLIKINMMPEQSWTSSVKLVNNNSESITVFANIFDFKSKADGTPEFMQKSGAGGEDKSAHYLLSQWVEISGEPIVIPPQSVMDVPYTISLPADAEPGGHYGAIMIGTRPQSNIKGSGVAVSSVLTSLILLKVKGAIEENGRITRFNTNKRIFQRPEVEFEMSFENLGNVHLQPKGEIKIFNMLNKEVGAVKINQSIDSGNVLPESSRKWVFPWSSADGILKMGRYKAILTLSYGEEKNKSDIRVMYFWVLNFKSIGIMLGSFALFIILLISLIKFYIKRAMARAQKEMEIILKNKALEKTEKVESTEAVAVEKVSKKVKAISKPKRKTIAKPRNKASKNEKAD